MLHQKSIIVKNNQWSLTDVVCARVCGANTTPYLNSAMNFAKQKTSNYFLLLQNMNSVGENKRVQNPARIPPQTPPAGGTGVEAGRIHIPSQLFRPAESIQISSSGFSAKYIRTLSNKYRQFWKFVFEAEMGSPQKARHKCIPPPKPCFSKHSTP